MPPENSVPGVRPNTENAEGFGPHSFPDIQIPPPDSKQRSSDLDTETDWSGEGDPDKVVADALNAPRTHVNGNELSSEFSPELARSLPVEIILLDGQDHPMEHLEFEKGDDWNEWLLFMDGVLKEQKGEFTQVMFRSKIGDGWHLMNSDLRMQDVEETRRDRVFKRLHN